jgi:serine/threonine-protein kinase
MSAGLPQPLRAMTQDLPQRIGSYEVRRVIGTGSMGVVYLGHDRVIDRPVAIKTIRRHLLEAGAHQHNAAERFRVEAQAAGRLSHRNIVSVYHFGEDEDCAFIVMEYVPGHSLAEYLRRPERLTKDEVLCLANQLLDALHYAHERGVVHRDIKPANLMIDREGRLKITDFGIARTESSQLTRVNAVVGSPGYMAPEQYTGGALDRRADVFASGVLLYQMLAGSMPFSGTDEAVMYQIVYGQHESLVQRSGDPTLANLDAIVDGALAKKPAERFATALEFRAALNAAVGRPVAEALAPERLLPLPATDAPTGTPSVRSPPSRGTGGEDKPTSVPVPTGWDESRLAELERELTAHVGPVARVLVRRAAREQTDLAVVRERVAGAIVDPDVRERFLARTGSVTRSGPPATIGPAGGRTDTRPTHPPDGVRLRPEDVEKAAAALVHRLGPIAGLLAKRCAEGVVTREQFVARVLEQLAAPVDAKAVEAELWRSLT